MAGPAPEFEDFGEEDEGAKEMVRRLQSAWVSEKAAPEVTCAQPSPAFAFSVPHRCVMLLLSSATTATALPTLQK